jgi:hypothetical protein
MRKGRWKSGAIDVFFLGCSSSHALMTMDAKTGAILYSIPQISGADEVTYDPVTQTFLALGTTPGGAAILAEISPSTGRVLATAPLPANAFTHSIAAGGARVYVPVAGDGMVVHTIG